MSLYQRARQRADRVLHHAATELAIVFLIIASVGLLVAEAVLEQDDLGYEAIEAMGHAITWVFVVEMLVRFWVARKKRRFFRHYWVDLLALLPVLRAFRFFRVLRLLRLLRVGSFLSRRITLFRGIFEGALGELTFLGTLTGVLVVASTTILYLVEQDQPTFTKATDTAWFAVFSVIAGEPVGGEPHTALGRTVTLALMLGGMTIFGMFIGTISASMVARMSKRTNVQLDIDELVDHVIVCGWNASAPIVLRELFGGREDVPVVLITERDQLPDDVPLDVVRRDLLYHVTGDFSRVDIIKQANLDTAGAVIILSDNLTARSDQDRDARTVLTAMTVERLRSGVFTCAELRSRENDELLRMVGVDEIVVPHEYNGVILGSVSRNRGLVRVLDEILSTKGNSFHKVTVPGAWGGKTIQGLFAELKERHDAILISLERFENGKLVETIVNPPLDLRVAEGDAVVVLAPHPLKVDGTR